MFARSLTGSRVPGTRPTKVSGLTCTSTIVQRARDERERARLPYQALALWTKAQFHLDRLTVHIFHKWHLLPVKKLKAQFSDSELLRKNFHFDTRVIKMTHSNGDIDGLSNRERKRSLQVCVNFMLCIYCGHWSYPTFSLIFTFVGSLVFTFCLVWIILYLWKLYALILCGHVKNVVWVLLELDILQYDAFSIC